MSHFSAEPINALHSEAIAAIKRITGDEFCDVHPDIDPSDLDPGFLRFTKQPTLPFDNTGSTFEADSVRLRGVTATYDDSNIQAVPLFIEIQLLADGSPYAREMDIARYPHDDHDGSHTVVIAQDIPPTIVCWPDSTKVHNELDSLRALHKEGLAEIISNTQAQAIIGALSVLTTASISLEKSI